MKKRAKIITTVASLCLAVALMAFGVYAATSVTFSVQSSVSFVVTDVIADITVKSYLNNTGTIGQNETEQQSLAAYTYYRATPQGGTAAVTTALDHISSANTQDSAVTNGLLQLADVAYTTANRWIIVTIDIANAAADGADIRVTVPAEFFKVLVGTYRKAMSKNDDTPGDPVEMNETYYTNTAYAQHVYDVAPQTTLTLTFARYLEDVTTTITGAASNSIGGTITIVNVASLS